MLITKLRIPKLEWQNFSKYLFVNVKNFRKILNNPNKQLLVRDECFQQYLIQEKFDAEIKLLKNIFIYKNCEFKNGCIISLRGSYFVKPEWNIAIHKESDIKVTDGKECSTFILNELNIKI